jgi:hypothetical protein
MNLIGCGKDVSLPALLPSYVSDVYLLKVTNKRPRDVISERSREFTGGQRSLSFTRWSRVLAVLRAALRKTPRLHRSSSTAPTMCASASGNLPKIHAADRGFLSKSRITATFSPIRNVFDS